MITDQIFARDRLGTRTDDTMRPTLAAGRLLDTRCDLSLA